MRQVVPELVIPEGGERRGAAHDAHRQGVNVTRAEQPPGGQHQQALRHHQRNQAEMRTAHRDVARQAKRHQMIVDHPGRGALRTGVQRHRRDVFAGQIALCRPGARAGGAHHRVVFGHQADNLVGHQRPQVQLVRRLEPVADHQIDLAGRQTAPVVKFPGQWQQFQPHQRRGLLDVRDQLGQEQRVQVVTCSDTKSCVAGKGVETALARMLAEQPVRVLEHPAGRLKQFQRRRSRQHVATRPHQQRVTRQCAQPFQLGTDSGLRAVQAHGGPGNAAFGDQCV